MPPLASGATFAALRDTVYLNQASLGLVPQQATEAMVRFQVDIAQHGNVRLSDDAEAAVLDALRATAATFLDAPRGSVAVVGGASEALGQVTSILATRPGDVVLVRTDFPSVTYPWLAARERLGTRIRWVDDVPAVDLTEGIVQAIDDGVGAVCVSAVQYATGTAVDVTEVVRKARAAGAAVVVDATQLAGAAPMSVREWSADAVVCSGYKWLSGHGGVALLAVGDELAAATPHVVGWKGVETPFDFRPGRLELAPDARRFELSTMSYGAAVSLAASIELLSAAGMPAVGRHARALAQELAERAAPLGWRPFRPVGTAAASDHLVSLRHPTAPVVEVQQQLAGRGAVVSARGGGIRVSLHHYNQSSDLTTLVDGLAAAWPGPEQG